MHKLWISYVDKYCWCVDNYLDEILNSYVERCQIYLTFYHNVCKVFLLDRLFHIISARYITLTILCQYFKLQKCEKYNLPLKNAFALHFVVRMGDSLHYRTNVLLPKRAYQFHSRINSKKSELYKNS